MQVETTVEYWQIVGGGLPSRENPGRSRFQWRNVKAGREGAVEMGSGAVRSRAAKVGRSEANRA